MDVKEINQQNRNQINILLENIVEKNIFSNKNIKSFNKVLDFVKNNISEKKLNLVYNKLIKLLFNIISNNSKKHTTRIGVIILV